MDYEAEHRKLWDLIIRYLRCGINELPRNSQEIVDMKRNLIKSMGFNPHSIPNGCFACAYTYLHDANPSCNVDCHYCPLIWRRGACFCPDGEYSDFLNALGKGERRKAVELAKCIRDLPWED